MKHNLIELAYLLAIFLFILGIKRLSKVRTAPGGNLLASLAMLIAIVAALFSIDIIDWKWIVGGAVVGGLVGAISARIVPMTQMPEMVALFNGSGGAASLLVAVAVLFEGLAGTTHALGEGAATTLPHVLTHAQVGATPESAGPYGDIAGSLTLVLSVVIGGITLSGSVVAWGKLSGKITGSAVVYKGQHAINALLILATLAGCAVTGYVAQGYGPIVGLAVGLTVLSLVLGVLLVLPIGGADMPVVISLLNSYSGVAASMTGFVLQNNLLIVSGALVGASGLILTQIMCKAMNRSLLSVLLGGFGATTATGGGGGGKEEYTKVKSTSPEELAMMMDGISSLIVVPGYGLAVSQAQHAVRELAEMLEKRGVEVKYAIHPVAGRMPGHMNVLLAESNVPYEQLYEMDQINGEFKTTDMVIVLGANDVVNPAALDEPDNPLWGMPILNAHEARTVIIVKRSLSPGYAGVKNKLFEADNALMMFLDAKEALQQTMEELKAA